MAAAKCAFYITSTDAKTASKKTTGASSTIGISTSTVKTAVFKRGSAAACTISVENTVNEHMMLFSGATECTIHLSESEVTLNKMIASGVSPVRIETDTVNTGNSARLYAGAINRIEMTANDVNTEKSCWVRVRNDLFV